MFFFALLLLLLLLDTLLLLLSIIIISPSSYLQLTFCKTVLQVYFINLLSLVHLFFSYVHNCLIEIS